MENQGKRKEQYTSSMQLFTLSFLILVVLGLVFLIKCGISFFI
jgi:hypothetical protein